MKVLILTYNTENSVSIAARAICEALRERDVTCETIDIMQFGFFGDAKTEEKRNLAILQQDSQHFRFGLHRKDSGFGRQRSKANGTAYAGIAKRVEAYGIARGFDAVLCLHPFCAAVLTNLREKSEVRWKQYYVSTDYLCPAEAAAFDMDAFFVPHDLLREDFLVQGIPAEKLVATGIPVSEVFLRSYSKISAQRKLNLDSDRQYLLCIPGSLRAGVVLKLIGQMAARMTAEQSLLVICGGNRRLQRQLEKKKPDCVELIGYTNQVDLFMDASELVLMEADGAATTQALMKRIPIVLLSNADGAQMHNSDFLCNLGCAASANQLRNPGGLVEQLAADRKQLEQMRGKMERFFRQRAADDIAARVLYEGNYK